MNRIILAATAPALAAFAGDAALAQTGGFAVTLAGQETPALQPWTKPASISWMESTDDAEDRFTFEAALKATRTIASRPRVPGRADTDYGVFGRLVAATNDQEAVSKRKSTYKAQAGLQFDWYSGGPVIPGSAAPDGSGAATDDDWTAYADLYVSYDQARTFGDPKSAACVANPALASCGEQDQTSYRLAFDVLPEHRTWSSAPYASSPRAGSEPGANWAYDFGPKISIFHDQITQAVLDASGQEIDGSVSGVRLQLGGALSPPVFQYKVVFRGSYQHTWALQRSTPRKAVFGASTGLFSASVDYNLGPAFWEKRGRWAPSIGLTYTAGEDPLEGRKEREDKSLMLRLTFAN